MIGKNNYQDWYKEDLIQEIQRLKKRKKYGLVWDSSPSRLRGGMGWSKSSPEKTQPP